MLMYTVGIAHRFLKEVNIIYRKLRVFRVRRSLVKFVLPIVTLALVVSATLVFTIGDEGDRDAVVVDPVDHSDSGAVWVPTPDSIQGLVNMNAIDAVAIGFVTRLDKEVVEGPYDKKDSDPPVRGFRYSYYEIKIDELLLDDGIITDNPYIKLKGHTDDGIDFRRITLPEPGNRFVFFLDRNPDDLSYSLLGPWAMIKTDTGTVKQFGGTHPEPRFAPGLSSDDFVAVVRSSINNRVPGSLWENVTVIMDEDEAN